MNEAILAVVEGDQTGVITLDMTGFKLGGLSDDVAEGRYEIECGACEYRPSSGGNGVNMRFDWRIIGPAGCSALGKHVISFHPVPVGPDPNATDFRKKAFFLRAVVASSLSHRGAAVPQQALNIGPGSFRGRKAYAFIVPEAYNGNPIGAVKSYLSKEDFDAAPGVVTHVVGTIPVARSSVRQTQATSPASTHARVTNDPVSAILDAVTPAPAPAARAPMAQAPTAQAPSTNLDF